MKKKFFVITIVILILATIAQSIGAYYLYTNPITITTTETITQKVYTSNKSEFEVEYEQLDKIAKQPKKIEDLYVTGWIPDWDIPDGLESIKAQVDTFSGISPVWFYLNEDGSLKNTTYTNGPALSSFAKENNLELVPSIALFDAQTLSSVLNSKENTDRHINEIVDQTVKNNYAGIDLDYESTFLADKELFYSFLDKLARRLNENNKILVFTVMPKWGNSIYYGGLPQTRRVQDYKRISDIVDEIRIMTYDFYSPGSKEAGPIAPLEWMEYVVKYAISEGVPREKILLGIHNYSYDWPDRPISTKLDYLNMEPNKISDANPAAAYFNKQINQVKANYQVTETFNEEWGEAIGIYEFKGQKRIMIYPTNRSIQLRKQLAADYGLKGVAYWRIGDEDGLKY